MIMAINVINYGNQTLIDLRNDTVTTSTLLEGATAHDRTGTIINGAVSFSTIRTGTTDPSDSLGKNGDIYIKY